MRLRATVFAPWLLVLVGALFTFSRPASAQTAVLDVLFDLDLDEATGCVVSTAEGLVSGVEVRLRTVVEVDLSSVSSVTAAECAASGADVFISAMNQPSPPSPWAVVPGSGVRGATTVNTHIPMSNLGSGSLARAYVTVASGSGGDALSNADPDLGGAILIPLTFEAVPALSFPAAALLLIAIAALGAWFTRERVVAGVVCFFLLATGTAMHPSDVRAGLVGAVKRVWAELQRVAIDAEGDAPFGADLLNLFAEAGPVGGELWLRADIFFGEPICLDWGTVDPGLDYACTQEPPLDLGPFQFAVAMTFDDGPSLATTPQILSILRTEGIPATFFMVGSRLQTEAEQALAREIHDDPLFRVANHSLNHVRFTTISAEEATAQVVSTSQLIREALDDPCYFPRYFRFPYGASDCQSMEAVRAQGLGVAGVNIDPVDWCFAAGDGYCQPEVAPWLGEADRSDLSGYALSRLLARGGGIMLMHDIHQNTVDELPGVIAAFRAQGVTFVDLSDATLFPALNVNVVVPESPTCCEVFAE